MDIVGHIMKSRTTISSKVNGVPVIYSCGAKCLSLSFISLGDGPWHPSSSNPSIEYFVSKYDFQIPVCNLGGNRILFKDEGAVICQKVTESLTISGRSLAELYSVVEHTFRNL